MKEKRFFINFFQKFNFQNSQLWTFTLSFANNQLQAFKQISNKLKQFTYFCRDGNVVLRLHLEKVVIYNKKNILFLHYHVTTIDQSIDWGKYNIVINIYMPGLMPKVSHRHKYFLSQKFHYHLFAKNRNKKQESQVVFLTVIQLIQLLR